MIEYTVKIYPNGDKYWYLNGKRHRTDGPAVEWVDGTKYWFLNGKSHRQDGPAVEYANGTKYWYLNGKRHRTDGPAFEYADGSKEWYLNGQKISEEEFNNRNKVELSLEEISEKFNIPIDRLRIKK